MSTRRLGGPVAGWDNIDQLVDVVPGCTEIDLLVDGDPPRPAVQNDGGGAS